MTLLSPLLAGIAAAVAVPTLLILYFLKLRRRDVEVSTTLLWKKAIEDLQANAPFQRLRRNLLLFLQLLVLGAALLALAQPELQGSMSGGVRHVLLIDRSGSMQTRDGGEKAGEGEPTRLERARRDALAVVDALREPSLGGLGAIAGQRADEAMVIAFDRSAQVVQGFTSSKAALREAIEQITATDTPTSVREAIKLAKAYAPRAIIENVGAVSVGGPARIHLFTDGRLPDASAPTDDPNKAALEITPQDDVVYHSAGRGETGNFGLVGLRAERAFDNPARLSIYVGVQSTFTRARKIDVQLSVDGQVASVRAVDLPPAVLRTPTGVPASGPGASSGAGAPAGANAPVAGGDAAGGAKGGGNGGNQAAAAGGEGAATLVPTTGGVVFTLERSAAGVFAVSIKSDEADALPLDDNAYLVVPPARALNVAVVSPGNLFLREALEGMNLAKLDFYPAAEGQRLIDSKRMSEYDVIVLDRFIPKTTRADGKSGPGLPAGRFLVLGAVPPPPLGLADDGESESTVIIDWKRDHPLLRGIGLDSLIINPGRRTSVEAGTPVSVVASMQGGPAIVEMSDAQTRAVVVTFDPTLSTWPLDTGYVLFLISSLGYLANDGAAMAESPRPGDVLSERLPQGAADVLVTLPDSTRAGVLPGPDGRVAFGPLSKTGVYTISWAGPPGPTDAQAGGRSQRPVAVNLLDQGESDVGTAKDLVLASRVVSAAEGKAQGARRLWPFLLLAALLVVLLEWYIYNRKVMI
jgi:hypothetical protein